VNSASVSIIAVIRFIPDSADQGDTGIKRQAVQSECSRLPACNRCNLWRGSGLRQKLPACRGERAAAYGVRMWL